MALSHTPLSAPMALGALCCWHYAGAQALHLAHHPLGGAHHMLCSLFVASQERSARGLCAWRTIMCYGITLDCWKERTLECWYTLFFGRTGSVGTGHFSPLKR